MPQNRRSQRFFDLALAVPLLALSLPLIAIGALATRASSRGPAFYRARRVGRGGRPFTMVKLRTMRVGGERGQAARPVTAPGDDRVTAVGRVLRALKIDELPQFWNVVRGDMAIVGPRPEDAAIVGRHYTEELRRSFAVRPGLTSLASLYWYPDLFYHHPPPAGVDPQRWYLDHHMAAELRLDLAYARQRTLLFDLALVIATPLRILACAVRPPARRPLRPLGATGAARAGR